MEAQPQLTTNKNNENAETLPNLSSKKIKPCEREEKKRKIDYREPPIEVIEDGEKAPKAPKLTKDEREESKLQKLEEKERQRDEREKTLVEKKLETKLEEEKKKKDKKRKIEDEKAKEKREEDDENEEKAKEKEKKMKKEVKKEAPQEEKEDNKKAKMKNEGNEAKKEEKKAAEVKEKEDEVKKHQQEAARLIGISNKVKNKKIVDVKNVDKDEIEQRMSQNGQAVAKDRSDASESNSQKIRRLFVTIDGLKIVVPYKAHTTVENLKSDVMIRYKRATNCQDQTKILRMTLKGAVLDAMDLVDDVIDSGCDEVVAEVDKKRKNESKGTNGAIQRQQTKAEKEEFKNMACIHRRVEDELVAGRIDRTHNVYSHWNRCKPDLKKGLEGQVLLDKHMKVLRNRFDEMLEFLK